MRWKDPTYPTRVKAPSSKGMTQLRRHWNGETLTQREAIVAKCCECMGYYIDGKQDCGMDDCPLYGYMLYNPSKYPKKKVGKRGGSTLPLPNRSVSRNRSREPQAGAKQAILEEGS